MKLAKENGYKLFETSAKENIGIDYMFTEIARMLYENPPKAKRKDTVKVTHTDHDEDDKSFISKISSWC
jgi:transcriptional regulator